MPSANNELSITNEGTKQTKLSVDENNNLLFNNKRIDESSTTKIAIGRPENPVEGDIWVE